MDTLKHIRSMQETAMALEQEARANGRYSRDCDADRVNDAIIRGQKSGVALLWDSAGKLEVVSLNNGADHVSVTDEGEHVTIVPTFQGWNNEGPRSKQRRDESDKFVEQGAESYEQLGGETFQKASARSHERQNATKGKFSPQSHATGDKARLNAELRKRQQMNADKEKSIRLASYKRNEELAQKAREFWNKKSA